MVRALQMACLLLFLAGPAAYGQSPSSEPSALPVATATPVPLPYLVEQADAATRILADIQRNLNDDRLTLLAEESLPATMAAIDEHTSESRVVVQTNLTLDTLRSLESDWVNIRQGATIYSGELTKHAAEIDADLARLADLQTTWQKTLAEARGVDTPTDVLERIEALLDTIGTTRHSVEEQRARVLSLQNRLAQQDKRVADELAAIARMRTEAVTLLFVQDNPAFWQFRPETLSGLSSATRDALASQYDVLRSYAQREGSHFLVHAFIIAFLTVMLAGAGHRLRPLLKDEPSLRSVMGVFDRPFAGAVALSLLFGGILYPRSPRLLDAMLGLAALVPSVLILRRLIQRYLYPLLNALVAGYLVDLTRSVFVTVPVLYRLVFFGEMVAGILFLAWVLRRARVEGLPGSSLVPLWRPLSGAARVMLACFAVSAVSNAAGYVGFARLAGNGALDSAYAAIVLYGTVRILDGLILFAMRAPPLSLLGIVRRHHEMLGLRLHRGLVWLAAIAWVGVALELFSLRVSVFEAIRTALNAELVLGSAHLSLGAILGFCLAVCLSFALSRFIRFVLDEDVYNRVTLPRGIPYAVSTVLHYVLLLLGFFIGVSALGIDMTKFTIVAGAFGVGLGFGLQNVVNNFVSGLILLFERPVHLGDVVELHSYHGDLVRIGLRASVIRTAEGSEVIVPNGLLISQEVVNWTLSDQKRRVEINVGVDYRSDPRRVIALLTQVAHENPDVLSEPAPQALFMGFGDNALDFQLRVWTPQYDGWISVRSRLNLAVHAALSEAGIAIPFPQRDLHLQSVSEDAAASLRDARKT